MSITARNPGADIEFADDLGVGQKYGNWSQNPCNLMKTMTTKIKYILATWQQHLGSDATVELMWDIASRKSGYKSLADQIREEFRLGMSGAM